ncbi:hypothetical protein SK571_07800 [Lentzea sp. BCCO 10_0798]|uniref:Uncharacterized protein n=1 Tax=Lentzea kristufekii TaxID=3095430 RepID=A0ABU4TM08_9PSEU|nr:hypothetical protein [Lentzea sp. BCCO 10_0798]MDX8049279.1 hypothetical protein [Lentzea sp. BCCO 10_0798]
MQTALILLVCGVSVLFLSIVAVIALLARRVRRGRELGQYRAKPNGTYDNSSSCAAAGGG